MNKQDQFIKDFQFDSNIIFLGNPGVGKTHIMKSLFAKLPENIETLEKYWIDDGFFRENITAGNMVLRENGDNISPLNYPLEMCIRAKVLFFDDIGASENVSDSQKTKLKFILDQREQKEFVTIFSTNLNPKELSELYGERIKSRIFNGKHKKGLKMINVPGEDKRKQQIENLTF